MSFSWKRFTLLGINLGIPVVVFLVKKLHDEQAAFHAHRHKLVGCDTCFKLLAGRAGPRIIMHLQDKHGLDLDAAIELTAEIYRQLLVVRREQQEKASA